MGINFLIFFSVQGHPYVVTLFLALGRSCFEPIGAFHTVVARFEKKEYTNIFGNQSLLNFLNKIVVIQVTTYELVG